jgi:Predicted signal-transduction protein containing cAMP-binding and CBS domains
MRKVKDIMSTNIVSVTMEDNIYEIAVKMKEHDIGFVPVVEGKKLLGVVTDRDLVLRGYAEKRSGSASVKEVMTTGIATVSPETTVDEASRIMAREKVRRLPVVDNGQLVGVVALGDMAVRSVHEDEAGEALSEISENTNKANADGKVEYAGVR